jgi:hypothetical protein
MFADVSDEHTISFLALEEFPFLAVSMLNLIFNPEDVIRLPVTVAARSKA